MGFIACLARCARFASIGADRARCSTAWMHDGVGLDRCRYPLDSAARICFTDGVSDADVAQLVEHHLAKVRVAGSNPVVRSFQRSSRSVSWWSGREARQRPAKPCTRVQIPSPPRITCPTWTISSAGERFPDTEEVTGSIPVSSTVGSLSHLVALRALMITPKSVSRPIGPLRRAKAGVSRIFLSIEEPGRFQERSIQWMIEVMPGEAKPDQCLVFI